MRVLRAEPLATAGRVAQFPAEGAPEYATESTDAERPRKFVPLKPQRIPGLDRAKVLVITPSKTRFTRVLRLRFKSLNGDRPGDLDQCRLDPGHRPGRGSLL